MKKKNLELTVAKKYCECLSLIAFSQDWELFDISTDDFSLLTEPVVFNCLQFIEKCINETGDRELIIAYSDLLLSCHDVLWSSFWGFNRIDLARVLASSFLSLREKNDLMESVKQHMLSSSFSSLLSLDEILESVLCAHECIFYTGGENDAISL